MRKTFFSLLGVICYSICCICVSMAGGSIERKVINNTTYYSNVVKSPDIRSDISQPESNDPNEFGFVSAISQTREEYALGKAHKRVDQGEFFGAGSCFEDAGDYENSMFYFRKAYDIYKESGILGGGISATTLSLCAGDSEGWVEGMRKEAENCIKETNYYGALKRYRRIFNTEKIKEVYGLMQKRARTEIR